ncbi:serine/threonine-protein kinase Kist [Octopus bimaculoides]|uniref:Protein kinase domain-containing protein n=1 Tax=Octopus bimaculoides TaxID=37653 RepID=A0A0L8HJ17_OCTBM|nr:serine/threonine-protein kinase Kist [Octopus bimaculoides]XP_014771940.1 serine/threonine-protein kinase Kist [Octopus bimaculoides]XP_052822609.1 serine/threonine-protein kinase Kist [Octopus bimaculoides]|eukprot:XP_014771939.1 PREDICTED: serine/threonine-protein kinase Kist-like [Octopus bimaculoides]
MSHIDTGDIINGSKGQRWKLLQQLGLGKCCNVYKAVLLDGDCQAAVKVYKKGLQYEGAQQREQLLLQIVLQKQGLCKQLVEVIDSFQINGHSILVEELLELNLYQIKCLTELKTFSFYMIQMFIKDVLISLNAIHTNGFVHGDLKPCNLMWSAQNGCMKLIDFGLSFHISDEDVCQIQSPSYRAPEVVMYNKGKRDIKLTQAVDLWSLGCLLIWMFTGQKMFQKKPAGPCNNCSLQKRNVENCEYGILAQQMIDDKISEEPLRSSEMGSACLTFRKLVSRVITCKGCERLTSQTAQNHPFFSIPFEPSFCDMLLLPTVVIRILNSIDVNETDTHAAIKEELTSRCCKFGKLVKCVLPTEGKGKGIIFMKFEKAVEAITAFIQINGKVLHNRTVITTYHSVRDFDAGIYY